MKRLLIDLPQETKTELDDVTREEGLSPSEIINVALKDYVFVRRFRSLRERMMVQATVAYTDQDVFDRVS